MSVLTEFVALRPTDAAEVDAAGFDAAAHGDWALSGNGIFDVELAILEEILTGTDSLGILEEPADVMSASDGLVFEAVRPSLTTALADRAGATDWGEVAGEWVQEEELFGADADALAELLAGLSDLASRAAADGRALYLWISA